jgi:DNA end-binding protein Ku
MKKTHSIKLPAKLSAKGEHEPAHQAIWSGTISFSLVAIPVHLVRAVEPGRISFRMLHTHDNSPLLRRMVCPEEEKIIPPEEIVRGFETAQGRYILITDEELESVTPERSRTIEIIEFVDMEEIDPVYYDHPYYLIPSKGGEKSYTLLAEVMNRTSKAGLAKFILGEQEYLVAVKSAEGVLSMITLHYSDEVLGDDDISNETTKTDNEEKNRIKKLIRENTVEYDPDKYADERSGKILDLLRKKARTKGYVKAPEIEMEEEGEGPGDLVALLRKSMGKVKKADD